MSVVSEMPAHGPDEFDSSFAPIQPWQAVINATGVQDLVHKVIDPRPNAPQDEILQHVASGARSSSAQLNDAIFPGDMLFVRGSGGGLVEIGTAGGFLGHVMLVVRKPHRIALEDEEAHLYANIWPNGAKEIWSVRTAEATRQRTGLHEADLILYVAPRSRCLRLIGEVAEDEILVSGEAIELWQSPEELRRMLMENRIVLHDVLNKMRKKEANWSWITAARAVTRSAAPMFLTEQNRNTYMKEVQECWKSDPICTSIIIVFWQRVLCKLAEGGAVAGLTDPAQLIANWMPLKSDRSLPGDLLEVLTMKGWTRCTAMERDAAARQRLLSANVLQSPPPPVLQEGSPMAASGAGEMTPAQRLAAGMAIAPRYCHAHCRPDLRMKGPPALKKCRHCQNDMETTYSEFALCFVCSSEQASCMICGASAPEEGTYVPPSTMLPTEIRGMPREETARLAASPQAKTSGVDRTPPHGSPGPAPSFGMHGSPAVDTPQVPPRFCSNHKTSDCRFKVDERSAHCSECRNPVQTTYAQFTFCAPCSEREESCMICGETAPHPGNYRPPAVRQPLAVRHAALRGLSMAPSFDSQSQPQGQPPQPQQPMPRIQEAPRPCAPPRYCCRHDSSDKRFKTEECKDAKCSSCGLVVETTYSQFSLCANCSNEQECCMICGDGAPQAGNYVPPSQKRPGVAEAAQQPPLRDRALSMSHQQLQQPLHAQPPQQLPPAPPHGSQERAKPSMPVGQMTGKPRFCCRHDSSEKRIKSEEPSLRECQKCKMQLHTNHKEFMFCPGCSEQEDRCMLCGTHAPLAGLDGSPVQHSPQPAHFQMPPVQHSPQPSPQQSPQPYPQQSPQHPQASPQPQHPQLSKALLQDSPAAGTSSALNLPHQGPQQPGPRFCCRHDASEKRPKQEEASFKGCRKCQMQLHTNHRELTLCPGCSEAENRCMICGTSAAPEPRLAATPVRSMVLNSRPSPGASPGHAPPLGSRGPGDAGALASGPPKYCFRHCTSDKRPKVESRIRECCACRTRIHTNLAEFALCAACCEKEQRCMVCGDRAEAIPPMPGIGASPELGKASSLSMQPMLGRGGLKNGLLGSPGAQPSAVAPALSGPGLPAQPQFQSWR